MVGSKVGALFQDIRYGWRMLGKSPGFTAIAVAILGLGIGACAAMISFADAVYLRALPYPDAGEIAQIEVIDPRGRGRTIETDTFRRLLDSSPLALLAGDEWALRTLTGAGEAHSLYGAAVTPAFFDLFGVEVSMGRAFAPADFEPGAEPVIVLSHGLWQRRFGGDPAWLGRQVRLDGVHHTVIGVLPPGVYFPRGGPGDFFVPGSLDATGPKSLQAYCRIPTGASIEQVRLDLEGIVRRFHADRGDGRTDWQLRLLPIQEKLLGPWREKLTMLLGAVGFVLLIGCANVAQMLLGRAADRRSEMAVRSALGAPRWRLLRQLLVEGALLASAGGLVGLLLAAGAIRVLPITPQLLQTSKFQPLELNATVVGATFLVCLLTVLVFAVVPAIRGSRPDLEQTLRQSGQGAVGSRRSARSRGLLIAGEIALSVALLACAGLLLRSLLRLEEVDPGFQTERALSMRIPLPDYKYQDAAGKARFYDRVLAEVRALPGVESAGLISPLPFGGLLRTSWFVPEGTTGSSEESRVSTSYRLAGPDLFRSLDIPLRAGRLFTDRDDHAAPGVVIVGEALARDVWPDRRAVGQRIGMGKPGAEQWYTVVGVVGDVRYGPLADEPVAEVYRPYAQDPGISFATGLVVRTAIDPGALASAVRAAIHRVDADVPVAELRTLEEAVSLSLSGRRFFFGIIAAFAAAGLFLAAAGVYGAVSYSVSQSTREVGVRMALGSSAPAVLRLFLGRILRWVAAGIAGGLLLASWASRLLTNQLYAVAGLEPGVLLGTAFALAVIATAAAIVPARRAARTDPAIALRWE